MRHPPTRSQRTGSALHAPFAHPGTTIRAVTIPITPEPARVAGQTAEVGLAPACGGARGRSRRATRRRTPGCREAAAPQDRAGRARWRRAACRDCPGAREAGTAGVARRRLDGLAGAAAVGITVKPSTRMSASVGLAGGRRRSLCRRSSSTVRAARRRSSSRRSRITRPRPVDSWRGWRYWASSAIARLTITRSPADGPSRALVADFLTGPARPPSV